jgi:uncharacterized protein with GYD domain
MSVYIVLGKYTHEGITAIKDSSQRLEASREIMKSLGGELRDFYYTMGRYDFIAICEAPSNKAAMQFMIEIGSRGAVSTETLTALPAKEGAELIKKLP